MLLQAEICARQKAHPPTWTSVRFWEAAANRWMADCGSSRVQPLAAVDHFRPV